MRKIVSLLMISVFGVWSFSIPVHAGNVNITTPIETGDYTVDTTTLDEHAGTYNWADNTELINEGANLTLTESSAGPAVPYTATNQNYTQTNGSLKIIKGSSLTVTDGGGITGGTVTLGDATSAGYLILSNGDNTAQITTNGVSALTISNTSLLDLNLGSSIGADATLNVSGELKISNGTVTIDNTDTWNGVISNTGGTLTLSGKSVTTTDALTYSQSADGALNVINGASLTLNTSDSGITGGTVNLGDATTIGSLILNNAGTDNTAKVVTNGASTLNINEGSSLTLSENSNIESGANLTVAGTLQANAGSVTVDNADTWTGAISNEGGTITLSGRTDTTTGDMTYTQGDGTLNLTNASSLELATADSSITGGTVNIGDTATTGTLILSNGDNTAKVVTNNASTLTINDGAALTLTDGSNIKGDATLTVAGEFAVNAGSVTIDNTDTWDTMGIISNDGGTLTLSGRTDATTENKTYTQGAGTLNIINGASLTLATVDSSITDGTVNIGDGTTAGSLIISNNYDDNAAKVVTNGASTLTISDGSTLTLNEDSSIGADAILNLAGTMTANSSTVTIDNADTWTGNLLNAASTITLSGRTDTTSATQTYNQDDDASVLNIIDASSLTLGSADSTIDAGTVNIGNVTTTGTLVLNNASVNEAKVVTNGASTLTISNGAGLNLAEESSIAAATNLTVAGALNISNGEVTLDNADTWTGALSNAGGTLHLINRTADETTAAKTYNQSAGILNLGTTAVPGSASSLKLATDASKITGGTVNLNQGSTLNLNNGVNNSAKVVTDGNANILTIGDGTTTTTLSLQNESNIRKEETVTIAAKSSLVAQEGATVGINEGDTWNGNLGSAGATVTLTNRTAEETTADKTYNQTTGTLNLIGSSLTLNTSDSGITGGTVNLGDATTIGSLILNNAGTDNTAKVVTNGASTLNINEGSSLTLSDASSIGSDAVLSIAGDVDIQAGTGEVNLNGDTWTGKVTLTNGTLNVSGYAGTNNLLETKGGTLNIIANSLNLATGSSIDGTTNTALSEGATLALTGGTAVLNDADTWSGAISNTAGDLTLIGRNDETTANKTYNQSTTGVLNLGTTLGAGSGSTLNLATADSKITGGTVNVNQGSTLTLNNGATNTAKVVTDGNGNTLTIGDGTTETTLITSTDSDIKLADVVEIKEKSTLNVNGGEVNVSANDTWTGKILTSAGNTKLTARTGTLVDETSDTKTYNQTSGTLTLDGSTLTLKKGSKVTGGVVTTTNSSNLTFDNGEDNTAQLSMSDAGSSISVIGSKTVDETVTPTTLTTLTGTSVTAGTITVGDGTYANKLTVANNATINATTFNLIDKAIVEVTGGSLSLDGSSDLSKVRWDGTLNQTAGTLTLANISTTGTDANKTGVLNVTGGNLIINGNSANLLGDGESIVDAVNLTLNSDLNIKGTSSVTISDGDTWTSGTINQTAGTLNLANITTGENQALNSTGGALNITGTGTTLGNATDNISYATNLTLNSPLNINAGTVQIDSADTLTSGKITVNGGSLSTKAISTVNNGIDAQTGFLQIQTGTTTLANANDSIAAAVAVTIDSDATLAANNGTVNLNGDTWNGKVSLGGSTLNVSNYNATDNKNGTLEATTGNLNVTGGTLTIGTGSSIADAVTTNISSGATVATTTGGTTNINAADTWSGNISNAGGTVKFTGRTGDVTTANQTYTQTTGTLTLDASTITLNTAESYIKGGQVNLDNKSNLYINNGLSDNQAIVITDNTGNLLEVKTGSTFTLLEGSSIKANDKFVIEGSSEIDVPTGVEVTLNGESSTWSGKVNLKGGDLTVLNWDGDNGALNATTGDLTIQDGTIAIASGSTIESPVTTDLQNDATLSVTGGTVTLDAGDTWAGKISVSNDTSVVTLQGRDDTTDATKTYNQTAGTLNLGDAATAGTSSKLNLATDASKITGGTVNLNQGSTLTLNNGTDNTAKVVTDGNANTLTIGDGTTTTTLTTSTGTNVQKADIVNLNAGSTLTVGGGSVTFDGDTASKDTWSGTVANTGGSVIIDNLSVLGDNSDNKIRYSQSGATSSLTLSNGSTLRLAGSDLTGTSIISNGDVNFTEDSASQIQVYHGGRIEQGAKINLTKGNTIELQENASQVPSMILDNADTWNGAIKTTSNGILQLNGYTNNKGADATYTQTGGALKLLTDSDVHSSFDLNNEADAISGGRVVIGYTDTEDPTQNDTGNTLTVSAGSIAQLATVIICADNDLVISGGSVVLNGDATATDTWAGDIAVSDGQLTLSSRTDSTTTTMTYNQTGGKLVLDGSTLTLNEGSKITGGEVTIDPSSLVFNNGEDNSAKITMTEDDESTLTIKGSKTSSGTTTATTLTTLDGTSITKGTVTVGDGTNENKMTLEGNSSISGTSKVSLLAKALLDIKNANSSVGNGATVEMADGSTMNVSGGTVQDGATVTAASGSTLNVSGGTFQKGATLSLAQGANMNLSNGTATIDSSDTWSGNVNVSGGSLTLDNVTKTTSGDSTYTQTAGTLNLNNVSKLTLGGTSTNPSIISGGTVNIGGTDNEGNYLTISDGGKVTTDAIVNLAKNNYINITGNASQEPSLYISNDDDWQGNISTTNPGILVLNNYTEGKGTDATYNQVSGTVKLLGGTDFTLGNSNDLISGGYVFIGSNDPDTGNRLVVSAANTSEGVEATVGENAVVGIYSDNTLEIKDGGTVIINDTSDSTLTGADTWAGNVILGAEGSTTDTSVLTLRNVQKDFTSGSSETATFIQNSGTLNIESNENGGSSIKYDAPNTQQYVTGTINIKGNDNYVSSLTMNYTTDDTSALSANLLGNAEYVINTNDHTVTHSSAYPSGTGKNNTLVKQGNGVYNVNAAGSDLNMGYNLRVENGTMNVNANTMTIGTDDGTGTKYGDLQIGTNTGTTHFYTNAITNNIYGSMAMYDGWYHVTNPTGYTSVGKNLYTGSGIDMMNGAINQIDVAGTTTVDNLKLKLDFDPLSYTSDTINSSKVVANANSTLDLVDYNLLSDPRLDKYTFRVVNAQNENYDVDATASKIVSQNKVIQTSLGKYQMIPSAVKGAFDMVLIEHNPQTFRGQVATNVIYANQLVISNQLFDRMFYSNLPYFNDDCSNKTASANTLFSPYQYNNNDTGLWFKPYANFENIYMNYGLNVQNNSYGALIGADFAKKKWGAWSFIPTVYVGYNGGRSTYSGVGMWHNGGQAGFMGTLTRKNFITSMVAYAGGYYNSMDIGSSNDSNALWNAGLASKTAYNIHLPWDFILQPTLYMAYNYVGASAIDSNYDNLFYKIDPLNAFSVAPGVNLIWQKRTFSIYATFQTMFSINATTSGHVAEIDMPHVGIKDPYFEYGLGATKFFKDRFSGYGQVTARSGSRRGIGFQLGMNMKL